MLHTIALIGFRGTGKTTLAQRTAQVLGCPCFSTDALVEQALGMSIRECVEQRGWQAFRQSERELLCAFAAPQPCVLDCGGGVVESAQAMEALQRIGSIVWIDAHLADIQQRLAADTTRPLLNHTDKARDIEENYLRRKPMYQRYAALYINTSETAMEQCVAQLATMAQQPKDTV